jgi:hypothetical protein
MPCRVTHKLAVAHNALPGYTKIMQAQNLASKRVWQTLNTTNQLEFALSAQLGLIRQRYGHFFANVMLREIIGWITISTCVDALRDMNMIQRLASAAYALQTLNNGCQVYYLAWNHVWQTLNAINQLEIALNAQLGLIRLHLGWKEHQCANVMLREIMYSMRHSTCVDALRGGGIIMASAIHAGQ